MQWLFDVAGGCCSAPRQHHPGLTDGQCMASFTYRKESLSAADFHALTRSLREELDVPDAPTPSVGFLPSLSDVDRDLRVQEEGVWKWDIGSWGCRGVNCRGPVGLCPKVQNPLNGLEGCRSREVQDGLACMDFGAGGANGRMAMACSRFLPDGRLGLQSRYGRLGWRVE